MKRLDLSLGRSVLAGSLLMLAVLLVLDLFFIAVDELDELGRGHYGGGLLMLHLMLRAPARAEVLLPVAVLLGSLLGLGRLAQQGELTAWRAAGVSLARILRGVLVAGVVLLLVSALLGEALAARGERQAQTIKHQAQGKGKVLRGAKGFWLRDGATLAHVASVLPDGRLSDITLYVFDGQRLLSAAHAARAQVGEGVWRLEDLRETRFGDDALDLRKERVRLWRNEVGADFLELALTRPDDMDARELSRYIAYLDHNGLDSRNFALAFWQRLSRPLAGLAMLLLAVPFVFGPLRDVQPGRRLLVGALVGIVYLVLDRLLGQFALVYGIAPALSALLPAAACALAGSVMLFRLERLPALLRVAA